MGVAVSELQIGVDQLRIGFFVSRLDRPWLDTPFPLQGFKITSDAQIASLRSYCQHVYIDIEKGASPKTRFQPQSKKPSASGSMGSEYERLRKKIYTESRGFEEELPQAQQIYQDLSENIYEVMDDLYEDRQVTLEALKDGVDAMLDSLLRNPSAFLWVSRLKQSDEYTYRHLLGTSIWCGLFGRHLGLERRDLQQLALGGLVLDVGKAKLPQEILSKASTLNEQEFALIKTHVDHSLRILTKTADIPHNVMRMVATHHERWDGSGYPMGLVGERIPIFGRVAGLVDTYEAITKPRPYAAAVSPHHAIGELYEHRGTVFQTELVEQFIQACGIFPTGSLVELSDGEVAVVIGLNGTRRLRPKVMVLMSPDKELYDEFRTIDLSQTHADLSVLRGLPLGAYGIDMDSLFL